MDPTATRKRQIAARLGVSVQVLEQYLQLKRAEVLDPDREEPIPADRAQSGREGHGAGAGRASARWSRRPHPVYAGRGRETRES